MKIASHGDRSRLRAYELSVPPNPLILARAVADEPDFCFLWSAAGGGPSFIACHCLERSASLDPEPSLRLARVDGAFGAVPRWIGLLPYESMRSLERPAWTQNDVRPAAHATEPLWYRYGAVAVITDRVLVVGDDPPSIGRLSSLLTKRAARKPVFAEALPPEPDSVHRGRIERALALIHQGHIYEVNLARRIELKVRGRAIDWLDAMSTHAPAPYAAAFELGDLVVASTSPELFLALDPDRRAWTAPIKGTRPRGDDAATDAQQKCALDADPKEQAELWMVVDVERNDLGRVARPGTVRLLRAPHIETHRTLHHRLAIVGARLRIDVSREALLRATLPSGSVTGAPKVRAMEVIAELESCRRGLYTGAFGFVRHDGGLRLAMAIRTLTAKNGIGHYGVGGGIVADSDPDREVTETRWKAVQVQRLLEEFQPHGGRGEAGAHALSKVGLGLAR